jgi:hypothetical protein
MGNNCLPDITSIGKNYVVEWLNENGYSDISTEPLQQGGHALKAMGTRESLLVQVRTFLHPQKPVLLDDLESDTLTDKAAGLGLIAYVAYAVVDHENNLVGEIYWDRLSKFW